MKGLSINPDHAQDALLAACISELQGINRRGDMQVEVFSGIHTNEGIPDLTPLANVCLLADKTRLFS